MSILIKGMEMPKSCFHCYFVDEYGDCICKYDEPYKCELYNHDNRPDWCPLVPVPPHGRLIDADALRKCGLLYREGMDVGGMVYIPIRDVFRSINTAPTIIEAEEENDG